MALVALLHTTAEADIAQTEALVYRLSQSNGAVRVWTTAPADTVFPTTPVPADVDAEVRVYAAGNEFEPFIVVVNPAASGNVTVTVGDFSAGILCEIYQVKYVTITTPTDYFGTAGPWPDPLWPISNGDTVAVTANRNTAFWFSLYVPAGTPPGNYSASVTINGISIPVRLHVFGFDVPAEPHVSSQMNASHNTILETYGVSGAGTEYWEYVTRFQQFFMDHRLTPKSALWPGGVTSGGEPFIDYDCNGTLTDTDGVWGFEIPAQRWLDGDLLRNGAGFPTFMAATFKNNDPSTDQRPSTFCGVTRTGSDWLANPDSAYNTEWFDQYHDGLETYLRDTGYLDKAYHYLANEPQDQADYDAVAWYSRYLKEAAPDLRLAVSEEPKPEIFDHHDYVYEHQIDIWMAHQGLHYDPDVAMERLQHHGEETWLYFLKSTYLPRINPITIDHPAIEGKLLGWFFWKFRLSGLAYYQFNNWNVNPWTGNIRPNGQNGELFLMYPPSPAGDGSIAYGANGHRFVPSIRLEMIRDGFEDYEYLYLLNGGSRPAAGAANPADVHVNKLIGTTAAQNRDSFLTYNLRRLIGMKLSGEIDRIPDIAPLSAHPRSDEAPGDYYINFQDPAGEPSDTPLVVDGKTYLKIGDALYDPGVGYGWIRAADVPDSDFYADWDQWVDPAPKTLLGSSVINSWGREDVFEFDLPNATYDVTVCAGYRGGDRYHKIIVEGETVIDNEKTNNSWITRTHTVTVRDKKLTVQMGMFDQVSFINYLKIEHHATALEDAIAVAKVLTAIPVPVEVLPRLEVTGDVRIDMGDMLFLLQTAAELRP